MNIQQVIDNEQEITNIELSKVKGLVSFEKFYSDDVVIIQDDGTTTNGKDAGRVGEEYFNSTLINIADIKLLSSVVLPSENPEFEFVVIATWYYDVVTTMYPIKGNQTSFSYWKDDKIQKVIYKFGTVVIAP